MSEEAQGTVVAGRGEVVGMQRSLSDALTIASRLDRRYAASTLTTKGNRVWVAPSRVSWLEGAFWIMVTSDAPDYAPRPGFPVMERCADRDALHTRLALGGLFPDWPVWTPEYLSEPEEQDEEPVVVTTPTVRYDHVTLPLAGTYGM